jgi:hypothetical protein
LVSKVHILLGVAAASTLVAIPLAISLWRSGEVMPLKILTTVVLFVPVLGPLMYLLAYRAPPPVDYDLMDQMPRQHDVLDRWRDRLEAGGKLPQRWRMMDRDK